MPPTATTQIDFASRRSNPSFQKWGLLHSSEDQLQRSSHLNGAPKFATANPELVKKAQSTFTIWMTVSTNPSKDSFLLLWLLAPGAAFKKEGNSQGHTQGRIQPYGTSQGSNPSGQAQAAPYTSAAHQQPNWSKQDNMPPPKPVTRDHTSASQESEDDLYASLDVDDLVATRSQQSQGGGPSGPGGASSQKWASGLGVGTGGAGGSHTTSSFPVNNRNNFWSGMGAGGAGGMGVGGSGEFDGGTVGNDGGPVNNRSNFWSGASQGGGGSKPPWRGDVGGSGMGGSSAGGAQGIGGNGAGGSGMGGSSMAGSGMGGGYAGGNSQFSSGGMAGGGAGGGYNNYSSAGRNFDFSDNTDGPRGPDPIFRAHVGKAAPASHARGLPSAQDSTEDPQWKRRFEWSDRLKFLNKHYFGLDGFRMNQEQIINATLSGKDLFVLMPTGGGKSLCYQLPALCQPGLTVVISPLVSLIQVGRVKDFNSETRQRSGYYLNLRIQSESSEIKLLFVTPEKVAKSEMLLRMLASLHAQKRLSRVVVDEAHCVSQWGHDFRPDYKNRLIQVVVDEAHCISQWGHYFRSDYKKRFPGVPLMALTATAGPTVQADVRKQLNIPNCITFKLSFNRPNLRYEVIRKKKSVMEDICNTLKDRFTVPDRNSRRLQCGIIYCLSRNECEKVAGELNTMLKSSKVVGEVKHYHAALSADEREEVQRDWSNDKVQVIVATIAFGMGINKPDVRFVIHFSIPKSIEGYHQETGRAGRDGKEARCLVYYSYGDAQRMRAMLKQSAEENGTSEEQQRCNMKSLKSMIQYTEDETTCRRVLLLQHFGETFEAGACGGTCDNCSNRSGIQFEDRDMREEACNLVMLIKALSPRCNPTYAIDVFRGSSSKQIVNGKQGHNRLPQYGSGSSMTKADAQRLLRRLVACSVLEEDTFRHENQHKTIGSVVKVNNILAAPVLSKAGPFGLQYPVGRGKRSSGSDGCKANSGNDDEDFELLMAEGGSRGAMGGAGNGLPARNQQGLATTQDPSFNLARNALMKLRSFLAERKKVKPETLLHPNLVDALAKAMPETAEELKRVQVGKH
eukprot:gene31530-6715_t